MQTAAKVVRPARKSKPRNIYCANCCKPINHYHRVDDCKDDCAEKYDWYCCASPMPSHALGREWLIFEPLRDAGGLDIWLREQHLKPIIGSRGPRILLDGELRLHGIEYGGDCLRCLKCKSTWSDIMAKSRWLRSGWWKCPTGCNVHADRQAA